MGARYPVEQQTTFELRDLRAELEFQVARGPGDARVVAKLNEVIREQDSRRNSEIRSIQDMRSQSVLVIDKDGDIYDPDGINGFEDTETG